MKKVRNELGLTNVQIMIPFVRNLEEAAGWWTCSPSTVSSGGATISS